MPQNNPLLIGQCNDDGHRFFLPIIWALFVFSLGLGLWHDTWQTAILVGMPAALIPSLLVKLAAQARMTRLMIGAAAMVFCALNIHQANGMVEFHFGIFVLLSFLVIYEDWLVILVAAAVIAVHHLSFNYLQELGFTAICFTKPGIGIVLLHAGYVVVESAALIYLAITMKKERFMVHESQSLSHRYYETMQHTFDRVKSGILAMTGSSREIAASNADLSIRSQSQASSIAQTAGAMGKLTSTVKQNADNANQINRLVLSSAEVAQKGRALVSEVVDTMGSIKASSGKIVDIIGVIDGIAFQTNILALNAAVEAARAGEQGRGFAVVASEVRNLAQRSATAAKEIKMLINDSVAKVEVGDRLVDDAGQTMEMIVNSVKQVAQLMTDISTASQEQYQGIERVNLAINDMEQMTQQNAALVKQAAAAAENMEDNASDLAQIMSTLDEVDEETDEASWRAETGVALPYTKQG